MDPQDQVPVTYTKNFLTVNVWLTIVVRNLPGTYTVFRYLHRTLDKTEERRKGWRVRQ